MFRAINAHLQEDTLYMVLSLSTRAHGGRSVHSVSENYINRCDIVSLYAFNFTFTIRWIII